MAVDEGGVQASQGWGTKALSTHNSLTERARWRDRGSGWGEADRETGKGSDGEMGREENDPQQGIDRELERERERERERARARERERKTESESEKERQSKDEGGTEWQG